MYNRPYTLCLHIIQRRGLVRVLSVLFAAAEISPCGQGKEVGLVSYFTTLTPPLGTSRLRTATDSKCRRAIKPKAQNLSTLSANARGDDILNRSQLCVWQCHLRNVSTLSNRTLLQLANRRHRHGLLGNRLRPVPHHRLRDVFHLPPIREIIKIIKAKSA